MEASKAFKAKLKLDFKDAEDVIQAYYNSDEQWNWADQFSEDQLSYMLDLFDGYDIIDAYCAVRDAYDNPYPIGQGG